MASFVPSFNIEPGTTAEQLAMHRRIGEQLMMAAASEPVSHWTQGMARIAQGLVGGYDAYQAGETDKAQTEEAGNLVGGLFDLGGDAPAPAAAPGAGGIPPQLHAQPAASPAARMQAQDLTSRLVQAESGGRSNARNPRSSAAGPGQFIDSTWLDMIKRHKPELMQGRTPDQVLALRTDPSQAKLSREMTGLYSGEVGDHLRRAGIEPTDANISLAYFLGPGDAVKAIRADPKTPAAEVISPAAIKANPHIAGMTTGRLQRWAAKRVGSDVTGSTAAAPAASSDTTKRRRVERATALWKNPQTRPLAMAILGKHLGENPTDTMREYELAKSQGYKGSVLDYQKELKSAGKESGLTDDLKEYQYAVAQGGFNGSYADWEGLKKTKGLSATEMKSINEAEDAIPAIEGTLANLQQARALNEKAFTGTGAEIGATIGTSGLPGANLFADEDRAKATREWMALMRPEAIQAMASTLTGATTNFELQEFVKVLADPTTPVDQRRRTIDRMIKLAEGKERTARQRVEQMRERTYFQPGGGTSGGTPAAAGPRETPGAIKWEKGPDGKPRRVQ